MSRRPLSDALAEPQRNELLERALEWAECSLVDFRQGLENGSLAADDLARSLRALLDADFWLAVPPPMRDRVDAWRSEAKALVAG